jgi:glutaredoxin
MENVILYEHGCPKCKILKMKLDQKGIQYEDVTDVEVMKSKGFKEAPKLEVDGVVMGFKEAVDWIANCGV